MLLKVDKWLLRTAAALLFMVGLLKITGSFTHVAYLADPDPVLSFLSNKLLLRMAGVVELIIAMVIVLSPREWYARYSLLSLCSSFMVYRSGLLLLNVQSPCPCLGRASDWLHLTPRQADHLALLLLVVLLSIAITSIKIHTTVQDNLCAA